LKQVEKKPRSSPPFGRGKGRAKQKPKMIMKATATIPTTRTKTDTRLVDSLNLVLADTYALLNNTHTAHWNVEGPNFFDLHKAFEEHYENLFEATDEVAERIRALDSYTVAGLSNISRTAGMDEIKPPIPQKDYVAALIVAHEKLVDDAHQTRNLAGEMSDLETQDLMIKRLQWHQKTIWMLKSFLK
jgi:starvation-inducible DNA-binding protein